MSFELAALPPSPDLAPFVEVIWGVRGSAGFDREVILPNGAIELMVTFGPTQKVHAYGDRRVDETFGRAWVAGIQDEPLTIGSPWGADHVAVRFRPGGAHAFFDLPMDELRNRVVDLDLLVGHQASSLRARLGECRDHAERARALEGWLLGRRPAVHPYYATVRRALQLVRDADFRLGVGEVCDRLGLSNRHLIDQFRRVVGLPPKTTVRIDRFHAVVAAIRGRTDPNWSRLAHRFHFADQSHLIREFRRFAGVPPTEFLARRGPDEDNMIA
jgi:AraC-like DNA-binding protein